MLPALGFYAMFVLQPLVLSFQYSFYEWNGVGQATWVGLENYGKVFADDELIGTVLNSFKLIVFFSFIPVSLGCSQEFLRMADQLGHLPLLPFRRAELHAPAIHGSWPDGLGFLIGCAQQLQQFCQGPLAKRFEGGAFVAM